MTDKAIEVRATEVPGMQIEFQGPIGPDGLGVGFRIAVDATIGLEDLNIQLDIVAKATRRQRAMEQLPLEKQRLSANLNLLKTTERERARHLAGMTARTQKLQANRRNPVEPMAQDTQGLIGHDNEIRRINGHIEGARAAIPYLEAVIAGEEPPELYPDAANDQREAAE
jgi:hypothetical protein